MEFNEQNFNYRREGQLGEMLLKQSDKKGFQL